MKRLRVEYVLDGMPKSITVAEGETLAIPDTFLNSPPFRVERNAAGQWEIAAPAGGEYRLSVASGSGEPRTLQASVPPVDSPASLTGPWEVFFPPGRGAPEKITLGELISWPQSTESGVRYFSGTARYVKAFDPAGNWLRAGCEMYLDLGEVKNVARVRLNGQDLGILWKPPFRVNLTGVVRPGRNELEIEVTNLWPNRLIGDEQLPPDCEWNGKQLRRWPQWLLEGKPSPTGRITFTTWHHYTKDDALCPPG